MILINVRQGSLEWIKARLGIPTASAFEKIITPKTLRWSASATAYMHGLVAEWALRAPLDDYANDFMMRGQAMEEEAVTTYEWDHDVETQAGGLVLRDDGMAGASPDRFVGTDGLLEVKCPGAKGHVGYLLGNVAEDHRCQVQGQLWIAERQWCDVLSYSPAMPTALVRVDRDEEFIAALKEAVDAFVARMLEARAKLVALGFVRPEEQPTIGGANAA